MLEKTEGEIKNGQSRDTGNIRNTRHKTKTKHKNKTTHTQHRKLKKMSNTDPTKFRGRSHVLLKEKQFVPLIGPPPCYSYIIVNTYTV